MANYTEYYHLHQWEPEDSFLRTDFNEDFRRIAAALQEKLGQADRAELAAAAAEKAKAFLRRVPGKWDESEHPAGVPALGCAASGPLRAAAGKPADGGRCN